MNLVATHQNADLDGLASMVALHLLRGPLTLVRPAGMDPDTQRFWRENKAALPPLVPVAQLDLHACGQAQAILFVVDTANSDRLGGLQQHLAQFAQVLAYDTHPPAPTDLPRATLQSGSACISGLVLALAAAHKVPSAAEAGLFLLGIHQDTGHFTFASVLPVDYQAAAQCMLWGAPAHWPARYVPKGFTRDQLALLETMAKRVELLEWEPLQAALISLELPDYEPNLAVLLEQLREAESWPTAVVVASFGERAFCIGRSHGGLDVAAVMGALGGGGHPEAASAVLHGVTLADALKTVRQTLLELMGAQTVVAQVAARPVISLPAAATVEQAAEALHKRRFNAIPLSRGRGAQLRYVGVVTRQDVDAALRHGYGQKPVREISVQAPTWVTAQAPLWEARRLLLAGPRRLLLVGTPPRAEGVLTRGLLLRASVPAAGHDAHRPPQPQIVLSMVRRHVGGMWPLLEELAKLAERLNLPIYLVGGSVRDLFLQLPGRDLDLVVEGNAPELAAAAAALLGGEVASAPGFGTARWYPPDSPALDFASARSEYYSAPGALPQVEHASLNQDLFRRDFTVNALALALSGAHAGRVYDPYGGFDDLRDATLRVLHGLSFHDDPTRALRAVRFAARFDFRLAPDTQGLLKAALRAAVIETLSLERIGAEFDLVLGERDVVQAFRLLRQWNLVGSIAPNLRVDRAFLSSISNAQQARQELASLLHEPLPSQTEVLWLFLACRLPKETRGARQRLVSGGGKDRRQRWLLGPEKVALAVGALGSDDRRNWGHALDGLDAPTCTMVYAQAPSAQARDFIVWWCLQGRTIRSAVTGHSLRALGFPAGPGYKKALDAALDAARAGAGAADQLEAAKKVLTAVAAAVGHRRG